MQVMLIRAGACLKADKLAFKCVTNKQARYDENAKFWRRHGNILLENAFKYIVPL